MKRNIHELLMFVDLACELGIHQMHFNGLEYKFGVGISNEENSINFLDKNSVNDIFEKVMSYSKSRGIAISLPSLDKPEKKPFCIRPFFGMIIGADGTVYPCCKVYDVTMGNVFDDGVQKIWNSKKYVKWREKMLSESPPLQCINCANYHPYTP